MSIHINLSGDESKEHVSACYRALSAYAGLDQVVTGTLTTIAPKSTPAPTPAAEAPKGETAAQKKAREKAEAAAAAEAAAEAEAAAAAEADTGPDVTVEEIRALAGKFNNDDTRPAAIQILADHGASSVSWFKDRSKAERVTVHAALVKKLAELQNAALN